MVCDQRRYNNVHTPVTRIPRPPAFPIAPNARSMPAKLDAETIPMTTPKHPDGEPWQWPEATWRKIVGRARAGRSMKPKTWPGGARCAVAISFDADHETIPLRDNDESPMRISQGQYGQRQATPASVPCSSARRSPPRSSTPPSPPCCIRRKSAASRRTAMRSASTPGSTKRTPPCHVRRNAT